MDDVTFQKYLDEDFAEAVRFYDDRACEAKFWYRFMSVGAIFISFVLTLIIAFGKIETELRVVSVGLSALMSALTALLSHFKSHENWLSYRSSWDALLRERRFYETGSGEYKNATDKDTLFVERIEAILARESSEFYARHAKGEGEVKASATLK